MVADIGEKSPLNCVFSIFTNDFAIKEKIKKKRKGQTRLELSDKLSKSSRYFYRM